MSSTLSKGETLTQYRYMIKKDDHILSYNGFKNNLQYCTIHLFKNSKDAKRYMEYNYNFIKDYEIVKVKVDITWL